MIAFCSKCTQLIRGKEHNLHGLDLTPEQVGAARVQEFDSLAAAMLGHINQRHTDREKGAEASLQEELSAVMYLAGKVYAMSLAQSTDDEHFEALREAWRASIFAALALTSTSEAYATGTADGTAAGSSPPPAGS